MGTSAEYRCRKCGYRAHVCGGHSCGFIAVLRTKFCRTCRELVDVSVGSFGKDGPTGDPQLDEDLNRCPRCKGKKLRIWKSGQPCPRCGGAMPADPHTICLWD